MKDGTILFEETLRGGGLWSCVLRRHTTLRLTDLDGGANVGLVAYNADQPLDRLNLPDTLKAQYTARLTRGHVLMSDMGHALLSITADSVGWHDPLGGHGNAALAKQKYGTATYQEKRNDWYRNAHDNFLIELGKHGLGKRDLVGNINFFSRIDTAADGKMAFHANNSKAGDTIDLRAEMNVLVVLNTCQHPLDPNPVYAPKPIKLTVLKTPPAGPDDFCRNFREENKRSFILTERLGV
ncbi:MAG TPA: urea amidolyase associated protein UAAP1 [Desulfuromonadaceae bacterium]|nr:urea amidolyase associated protein UAAP1 [Desulfuromonadaceae bacterium]